MGQTLLYGLQVAVVGMSIVFLGLVILIFLFKLMSVAVRAMEKKDKPAAEPVPATPAFPVEELKAELTAALEPLMTEMADMADEEIAAVIAAAVAAMDGGSGLVVRSIRRIGVNVPQWNAAGRTDIINTRA